MHQTKLVSLIEALCNIGSGFVLSLVVWQWLVAPLFGYEVTFADNLALTSIFTVISIARSFAWRRFFNNGLHLWLTRRFGNGNDGSMVGPVHGGDDSEADVRRTEVQHPQLYRSYTADLADCLAAYEKSDSPLAQWHRSARTDVERASGGSQLCFEFIRPEGFDTYSFKAEEEE